MVNSSKDIVIIGAGITGLTIAERLSEKYKGNVVVLEKEQFIGGLAATLSREGIFFDMGSHRLHRKVSCKIIADIERIIGEKLLKRDRKGKMYFRNEFLSYPPDVISLFKILPHYKRLYRDYMKKLWGDDSDGVAMGVARRRKVFLNLRLGRIGGGRDYYLYPKDGIGSISKKLSENIRRNESELMTQANIKSVSLEQGRITGMDVEGASGLCRHIEPRILISTAPIDDIFSLVFAGDRNISGLRWRGLILLYIQVAEEIRAENETYYIPESDMTIGRVSLVNRYSPYLNRSAPGTFLTVEIPSFPGDKAWNMEEPELLSESVKDLTRIGILKAGTRVLKHFSLKLDKAYPIYTQGWKNNYLRMYNRLNSIDNLFIAGRMGLFLHCNIDHCMIQGIELAGLILAQGRNNKDEWNKKVTGYYNFVARD